MYFLPRFVTFAGEACYRLGKKDAAAEALEEALRHSADVEMYLDVMRVMNPDALPSSQEPSLPRTPSPSPSAKSFSAAPSPSEPSEDQVQAAMKKAPRLRDPPMHRLPNASPAPEPIVPPPGALDSIFDKPLPSKKSHNGHGSDDDLEIVPERLSITKRHPKDVPPEAKSALAIVDQILANPDRKSLSDEEKLGTERLVILTFKVLVFCKSIRANTTALRPCSTRSSWGILSLCRRTLAEGRVMRSVGS